MKKSNSSQNAFSKPEVSSSASSGILWERNYWTTPQKDRIRISGERTQESVCNHFSRWFWSLLRLWDRNLKDNVWESGNYLSSVMGSTELRILAFLEEASEEISNTLASVCLPTVTEIVFPPVTNYESSTRYLPYWF